MSSTLLPPDAAPRAAARPERPSTLFFAFTRMALMGFGGVLPIAQHELVERLGWLTREEFVEMLSLGQVLPGPNVVNVSLMVGDRFFGWRGAMAALGGMIGVPLVLVLSLAMLYTGFSDRPMLAGALRGMGAVSAGLIIATALKLLPTLRRNPMGRGACALVAGATLAAVAGFKVPMVAVVVVIGGGSCAYAWHRIGRLGGSR